MIIILKVTPYLYINFKYKLNLCQKHRNQLKIRIAGNRHFCMVLTIKNWKLFLKTFLILTVELNFIYEMAFREFEQELVVRIESLYRWANVSLELVKIQAHNLREKFTNLKFCRWYLINFLKKYNFHYFMS